MTCLDGRERSNRTEKPLLDNDRVSSMALDEEEQAPSKSDERIVGLDIARSLAVFGMVFVNFRVTMGATAVTPVGNALSQVFDGRAAALFVVLAGVGVSLMSRQGRADGDLRATRSVLLKRSVFLFVVGLLYVPIWPADILHFYGLYLFAAAWLLGSSDRTLLGLAAGAVVIACGMLVTLDYEAGWKDWESLEYRDFWTLQGFVRNTCFNGFHPVFPWVGFLLLGMWLGRQRLDDRGTCWRYVAVFGSFAIGTELGSGALIGNAVASGAFSVEVASSVFGTHSMPPFPLYMIAAASTAAVVICVCVRLGVMVRNAAWLQPFVHTGQLALTLYVGHVVVGMGTLEMLGRLGNQTILAVVVATTVFCVASVICSHVWRSRFKRGPLEAVFRMVTGS